MPQDFELSVTEESTTETIPAKPGELKGGNPLKEGCIAAATGCGITLFPGVAAAGGAIAGALGAGILKAASSSYNAQDAAASGAAGSAVLAIPVTIAMACFACLKGNTSAQNNRNFVAATTLLTTGLVAISGALGWAMRNSVEMNAGQSTATTALGTAALTTVAAATTALLCRFM